MPTKPILVIDDEKEFLESFPPFFNEKNVPIETFLNTQDFYIKTQARDLSAYSAIFIDYHLPEETGLDFIDRFAQTDKIPQIYLMSGDPLVEGNLTNKPYIIFLKKPFNLSKIWDEELSLIF